MNYTFAGKQITGLLTVVPKNVARFSDEIPNYAFPPESSRKLQKMLGLDTHRYLEDDNVTGSDLALRGIRHLIDRGLLQVEDIDALLYVTQTPDYFIPPTSNVLQGALRVKHDAICLDINQGCAGFLVGLMQSFLLLNIEGVRKVVLINADTASKQTNNRDRNTFPLVGDAATITIVENSSSADAIPMTLKMDGSRWQALHVPAGAYRTRSTPETSVLRDLGNGNFRSLEHIHMDGNAIFNFTMTEVPQMISDILVQSRRSKDEIEFFMFHQPNKFILEKIADLLEIPREKMPNKTSTIYGNTSSCSIPQTICHELQAAMLSRSYLMCLAGFGVGLTWSAMVMRLGPLQVCEILEY
jgi:3-oxoacyl-[acyl-carrier-protein] synthase-3